MDIVRMCRMRIRVPDQWWGDYLATLGAARVGEREILALGAEVGWDLLAAYTKEWFDYSEKRMIDVDPRHAEGPGHAHQHARSVSRHAAGRRHHQGDRRGEAGGGDDRGRPPRQPGLHGERPEPLGRLRPFGADGRRSSTRSTIPCPRTRAASAGSRSTSATAASSVGRIHPTSCSVATTNIADRVANPVQAAIAELADGLGMAETGAVIPPSSRRRLRRPRRQAVRQRGLSRLHRRGRHAAQTDGWLTILHVGNAGMCYQDSIEIDELRHPIFVHAAPAPSEHRRRRAASGALSAPIRNSRRSAAI